MQEWYGPVDSTHYQCNVRAQYSTGLSAMNPKSDGIVVLMQGLESGGYTRDGCPVTDRESYGFHMIS